MASNNDVQDPQIDIQTTKIDDISVLNPDILVSKTFLPFKDTVLDHCNNGKELTADIDLPQESSSSAESFVQTSQESWNAVQSNHDIDCPTTSNLRRSYQKEEEIDDENDEVSSTISDLSGISTWSEQNEDPEPMEWVQRQMATGINPRELLSRMVFDDTVLSKLPPGMDDFTIWKIIANMLSEPPKRKKLSHINTMHDVVHLLKTCKNVVVLTGAGVSVSCGIPDFRSRDGIYSRLAVDFPDLPDPQAMFNIQYFEKDPRPFFKFAREIYPGKFKPSPCHKFIKALEAHGKLLRNYTQNIDTLEQVAGIENVIQCHGSFATATCTNCKHRVDAEEIREDIFAQKIPMCKLCADSLVTSDEQDYASRGVLKPDIVFFGEGLHKDFHVALSEDKHKCDLLIVIGSSLKVRPVALIPSSIPDHIPQILINREPLDHVSFDVELLGDGDIIVDQICRMLGEDWEDICWRPASLVESQELEPQKMETTLNPTNTQTALLDEKESSLKAEDTVQKSENNNENGKKRSFVDDSCDESTCKRIKLVEEDLTKTFREVRVRSVDGQAVAAAKPCSSLSNNDEESRLENDPECSVNPQDVHVDSDEGCDCSADKNPSCVKERQLSVDSTRDSGIGESNKSGSLEKEENEISISERLKENTYLFLPPNRYVFHGAEVYSEQSNDQEDSSSSSDDITDEDDVDIDELVQADDIST